MKKNVGELLARDASSIIKEEFRFEKRGRERCGFGKISTWSAFLSKIQEKFKTFFEKTLDETGKIGYSIYDPFSTRNIQVLKNAKKTGER